MPDGPPPPEPLSGTMTSPPIPKRPVPGLGTPKQLS
jgi:hypothetical protein